MLFFYPPPPFVNKRTSICFVSQIFLMWLVSQSQEMPTGTGAAEIWGVTNGIEKRAVRLPGIVHFALAALKSMREGPWFLVLLYPLLSPLTVCNDSPSSSLAVVLQLTALVGGVIPPSRASRDSSSVSAQYQTLRLSMNGKTKPTQTVVGGSGISTWINSLTFSPHLLFFSLLSFLYCVLRLYAMAEWKQGYDCSNSNSSSTHFVSIWTQSELGIRGRILFWQLFQKNHADGTYQACHNPTLP